MMQSDPGTYALILQCLSNATVQIGRWGTLDIEPGYYVYVGSAFGPGGVRARVSRHFRTAKAKRWHIDYLREFVAPVGAWYSHDARRLEHEWAQVFHDMRGVSSIHGFGCSDCKCYSHLFRSARVPGFKRFSGLVGGGVELVTQAAFDPRDDTRSSTISVMAGPLGCNLP